MRDVVGVPAVGFVLDSWLVIEVLPGVGRFSEPEAWLFDIAALSRDRFSACLSRVAMCTATLRLHKPIAGGSHLDRTEEKAMLRIFAASVTTFRSSLVNADLAGVSMVSIPWWPLLLTMGAEM